MFKIIDWWRHFHRLLVYGSGFFKILRYQHVTRLRGLTNTIANLLDV